MSERSKILKSLQKTPRRNGRNCQTRWRGWTTEARYLVKNSTWIIKSKRVPNYKGTVSNGTICDCDEKKRNPKIPKMLV
jgi:hypothetical protein